MGCRAKIDALSISLGTLALVTSCNNSPKKDTSGESIEKAKDVQLPNLSDMLFKDVFDALKNNDNALASANLEKWIIVLKDKGADLTGNNREALDKAIAKLNEIHKKLKIGKTIDTDVLMEAVVHAELAVMQNYLMTDKVDTMETPRVFMKKASVDEFRRKMGRLEATEKKLENDKDSLGRQLYKEGKILKKKYNAWKEEVEVHLKKTHEHFKEFHPKYYQKDSVQ